jgi:hypothetical protein
VRAAPNPFTSNASIEICAIAGQALAPGVYVARVTTAWGSRGVRVVKLR